ncbi:MAG TPA: 50S ribosomal protein L11 methyltransferase [Dongiaceae bacterium]|nr:50S ribosomal protein L11 methyltransferase [Dongiaceae bacterium]
MSDPSAFIRAETALSAPPLVPEIRLHLASEILPIWQATEADLARHGLPPPYWAFAWPGGQALTRHLLDHRELVAGRRVLDFAAGSGLSAIAAAMAGASAVAAADIDPFARAAIALNADTNGVDVALIEEDILLSPGDWPSDWDVILAGDVCYERPMAERVAAWFTELASAGRLVLIGDPGRSYLPGSGLREIARYQVPTSLELEYCTLRETVVWRWEGGA